MARASKQNQAEFQALHRRATVDKLGAIRERLAKVKLDQAAEKAICEEIRDVWMQGVAAASPAFFHGEKYTVHVTQRKFERAIDCAALAKRVGVTAFMRAATITMKAFEALVSVERRDGLVSMQQTGSREIAVVPLPAAAQAKKAA